MFLSSSGQSSIIVFGLRTSYVLVLFALTRIAVTAAIILGNLTGTLLNSANHFPIASATIIAKCAELSFATSTDAKGRFAFPSLPADTCVVSAHKNGYLESSQSKSTISVAADQSLIVNLSLDKRSEATSTPAPGAIPPAGMKREGIHHGMSASSHSPNYVIQRVYFATDRELYCKCFPTVSFNGEQNLNGTLRYGRAEVSIPRAHHLGGLESPSFWKLEFRADPEKHIVVISSKLDTYGAFREDLRTKISQAPKHEAFVFIHGYNVTFDNALRRTAQLAHDLGIAGPAIAFSWPAKGDLADYLHDENNVSWTTPHLERFLMNVAQISGVSSIHVIAHSMGNRALAEALAHFGEAKGRLKHINDVVLAAPDIDDGRFQEIASAFKRSVPHITIYASGSDKALQASHTAHGYTRLGDVTPFPLVLPGFVMIDATAVDTDWLGHGYFATSALMQDMYSFFSGNEPPRFGLQRETTPKGQSYWRFVRI